MIVWRRKAERRGRTGRAIRRPPRRLRSPLRRPAAGLVAGPRPVSLPALALCGPGPAPGAARARGTASRSPPADRGRRSGRRPGVSRRPRAARRSSWFWDLADPHDAADPGPRAHAVVLERRRGRVRADGLHGRRRARLGDARERPPQRVAATLRVSGRRAGRATRRRGMTRYRGFFYHFLDMETGERFEHVELSTIDTALLVAGALCVPELLRPRRPRRGANPGRRRLALPPHRVGLGLAAPARRLHGLDSGGGIPRLELARLRRGDDPLPPRPRLAHAPDRSGRAGTSGRRRTSGARSTGRST